MLGLHLAWWHYMEGLQLVLSKKNRIGDTKYQSRLTSAKAQS